MSIDGRAVGKEALFAPRRTPRGLALRGPGCARTVAPQGRRPISSGAATGIHEITIGQSSQVAFGVTARSAVAQFAPTMTASRRQVQRRVTRGRFARRRASWPESARRARGDVLLTPRMSIDGYTTVKRCAGWPLSRAKPRRLDIRVLPLGSDRSRTGHRQPGALRRARHHARNMARSTCVPATRPSLRKCSIHEHMRAPSRPGGREVLRRLKQGTLGLRCTIQGRGAYKTCATR